MQITNFRVNRNAGVSFDFCCEGCKSHVSSTDKFCRECGRKLVVIEPKIPMDEACGILTAGLRVKKVQSSTDDESEKRIAPASNVRRLSNICPRCKSSSAGCSFLRPDGKCQGYVLPTHGQEFDECVFEDRKEN